MLWNWNHPRMEFPRPQFPVIIFKDSHNIVGRVNLGGLLSIIVLMMGHLISRSISVSMGSICKTTVIRFRRNKEHSILFDTQLRNHKTAIFIYGITFCLAVSIIIRLEKRWRIFQELKTAYFQLHPLRDWLPNKIVNLTLSSKMTKRGLNLIVLYVLKKDVTNNCRYIDYLTACLALKYSS